MQEIKNIFVVGGGTAGHVIPAIQLSRELIKNNYKVIFITDYRMFGFVEKNIKEKNFKLLCLKSNLSHGSSPTTYADQSPYFLSIFITAVPKRS